MTVRPFESLPLGFRFRPTDEELVNHYLKRKIAGNGSPDVDVIPEVDMSKCEPWDLPDKSLIKSDDPEWFYFAPIDRKYPNGYRSNRATEAGYWKATGKDRFIRTRSTGKTQSSVIGMKKTLVFHIGRAPKGMRTNWIMHEYRTTEPEFEPGENGGYVLYRLFNKQEERNPIKEDECEANGSSPVANITKHEREELQEGPSNQQIFDNSAPTSSCIEKCLTDITECSANNDIDQKSKNRLLDENLMQLEQVAPDGFPRVSSPLRPYTDYPFPSNLNQEDCMKLFDFNNISNQDFVNNLISSVLPNSSYQDIFDGETLNRPYELFEVQRGGNVSLEGSSWENTVEGTGIRVTDRELNIDSEIPQQGNATRRFRLATRELFGGKCNEISRNDNEVLKYSGRVFIPKTKLKNLSLDGACCKDDKKKISENLTPKSLNESKRVLKIATRWHITWYVVLVILISVCVGTWRCLYSS